MCVYRSETQNFRGGHARVGGGLCFWYRHARDLVKAGRDAEFRRTTECENRDRGLAWTANDADQSIK